MYRALIIPLVWGLLSGCRKDRDTDLPRVDVLVPATTATLVVPDTLPVHVEVTSTRTLRNISIALTDDNGVPVTPPLTVALGSTSASIIRGFPVTGERIASGRYTLAIIVRDERNEARAFRRVNVQAAPLRLRALYMTPPEGHPAPVTIWRVDSTGTLSEHLSLPEFGGAAIDARRLYLAGTLNQPVRGIPQQVGDAAITIANEGVPGSGTPYFQGPVVDPWDGRFYVGTDDGSIQGYSQGGTRSFTAWQPDDLRSRYTAVAGETLVSISRHRVLDEWRMVTYARSSGVLLGIFPLDLVPMAVQARDEQWVVLFGERDGKGVVQLRHTGQGGGSDLMVFNDGPIAAVARIDAGSSFIALPDRILRSSANSNTPTVVAQGLTARSLAFEEASGSLYAGTDDGLVVIDPLSGDRTTLHVLPHPVGHVLPLLNR